MRTWIISLVYLIGSFAVTQQAQAVNCTQEILNIGSNNWIQSIRYVFEQNNLYQVVIIFQNGRLADGFAIEARAREIQIFDVDETTIAVHNQNLPQLIAMLQEQYRITLPEPEITSPLAYQFPADHKGPLDGSTF